jgi:predicted AAA+ superfamily ATPase
MTDPILIDINGITLFTHVRDSPLLRSLHKTLFLCAFEAPDSAKGALRLARSWAAFNAALAGFGGVSFAQALARMALADDNRFTHAAEAGGGLPPMLAALARADLSRLGRIAALDHAALGRRIGQRLGWAGFERPRDGIAAEEGAFAAAAPPDPAGDVFGGGGDWGSRLPAFIEYLRANGAGLLGQYRAFRWDGALTPVYRPDPIRLADLAGYEEQRSIAAANTLRLIEGRGANNLLFYGDRGTGKSATVKAIGLEYADRGLRLVELPRNRLFELSQVLASLASRALRFIVFIDDLCFDEAGGAYADLKTLLEGGLEARPQNAVVYATSNRRHLLKERFADRLGVARPDAEVRAFDAVQEQWSLADRFGLTLVYTSPSQERYLAIAEHIARCRGLLKPETPEPDLEVFRENALRWERWFNGRSPRTAAQYADWIAGGSDLPWE